MPFLFSVADLWSNEVLKLLNKCVGLATTDSCVEKSKNSS